MLNQTLEKRLWLKVGRRETSIRSWKDAPVTKERSEEPGQGQRALVNGEADGRRVGDEGSRWRRKADVSWGLTT